MTMRLAIILFITLGAACNALATSSPSSTNNKLELKYFNARGVAETARMLFVLANEDYVDTRFDIPPGTFESPDFKAAQESGALDINLKRAPVLVTPEGTTIGQSKAIERFIARRLSLMGSTDEEEALIDCVVEHCRDVKDAQMRKGFSAFSRDKTDEEKAEARKEWFGNEMPTMLEKMNSALKSIGASNGFAVGSAHSLADVAIFIMMRDCSPADIEDMTVASSKCDTLNAIAEAVAGNPNVAKWLEERPKTAF